MGGATAFKVMVSRGKHWKSMVRPTGLESTGGARFCAALRGTAWQGQWARKGEAGTSAVRLGGGVVNTGLVWPKGMESGGVVGQSWERLCFAREGWVRTGLVSCAVDWLMGEAWFG